MKRKKSVLITRKIPVKAEKMLRDKGYNVQINKKNKDLSKKELLSLLKKKPYDAVISILTNKIDKEILEAGTRVKIYSNYASGFDNIDIKEAKKRNIVVANSPAPFTPQAVAEHAIGLIFSTARRIAEGDRFIRAGKWKGWVPLNFLGTDMHGKTLGLVGAGRIGERVGKMAVALGMRVIYFDIIKNKCLEEECGASRKKSLHKLLSMADFVSLHLPLCPETRHIIGEKEIKKMKPEAYLINTARGAVIQEKALIRALKKRVIAGAGLDVFEFEPKVSPELKSMENVVLTPHIASASRVVRNQMAEMAAQNIISFFDGKKVKNKIV